MAKESPVGKKSNAKARGAACGGAFCALCCGAALHHLDHASKLLAKYLKFA